MSVNTSIYGLVILAFAFLKASAMSQIREDGGATFHLYNSGGHEYVEPFEYAIKRVPNSVYVRVGKSHSERGGGVADQDYGYGSEVADGVKAARARPESYIRLGRSSLKVPHHKIVDQVHGFERVARSGASPWIRVGRNAPSSASAAAPEAEIGILPPNILLERNAHCTKDLQQCYDKLAYVCGNDNNINNNNNNNGNGVTGDGSDDHLHRNNVQYFETSEGLP